MCGPPQRLDNQLFLFMLMIGVATSTLSTFYAYWKPHSYIDYYQLRTERDTRNNSLGDFQNLLTWWDSLSIIDKRTRKAKEKALSSVENGVLLLHERMAGAAAVGPDVEEEEHGDDDDK